MAKSKKKPKVNPQLKGFEMQIDSFGELKSTLDIDKINQFLDKNLADKKLKRGKKPTKGN